MKIYKKDKAKKLVVPEDKKYPTVAKKVYENSHKQPKRPRYKSYNNQ